MIKLIEQKSSRADRPWFTDVTVEADGLTLLIGGAARVAGVDYPLDAAIALEAPTEGSEHHSVVICTDGVLILDPGPAPSHPLYGEICWLDLPAGCTDLADIDVFKLTHIEEVSADA